MTIQPATARQPSRFGNRASARGETHASPVATIRILSCLVAGHRLAIDLNSVISVQQATIAESLPSADRPVGVLHTTRGDLPIFHLAYLLGLSVPDTAPRHLLIVEDQRGRWSLAVDTVSATIAIDASEITSIPTEFLLSSQVVTGLIPGSRADGNSTDTNDWVAILNVRELASTASTSSSSSSMSRAVIRQPQVQQSPGAKSQSLAVILEANAISPQGEPLQFCFSLSQVAEILPAGNASFLPCAQPAVLGVIPWQDRPLVAVDLPRYLSIPAQARPTPRRIAVIQFRPGQFLGFTIQSHSELLDVGAVSSLPEAFHGQWRYSHNGSSFLVPTF